MSILVVDVGGTNLSLSCQKGGHAAPRTVGTKPVGFAGEETSSIRQELMVVPVVLTELTPTIYATLKALFATGKQVACSGDVFNNGNATVTCSGILSDEFLPAGPWFVANLTLYEVGTGLGFSSGTTIYKLTNNPSPTPGGGGGGTNLYANPSGGPFGACFRVLDSATPATCAPGTPICTITYSLTAEKTWVTEPLAAGTLTGSPYVTFASKGINGLMGIALQSTKAIMYLNRASVDIQSWQTGYVSGDFAGGIITMYFPTNLLVTINSGDRIRIELWGRLALYGGGTDPQPYVLARQTICYPGELYLPGSVVPLP